MGILLVALAAPFLGLFGAVARATVLFWPTMLLLGGVHSYLGWVPALGWVATWLVVALLSLLVPTGGSGDGD